MPPAEPSVGIPGNSRLQKRMTQPSATPYDAPTRDLSARLQELRVNTVIAMPLALAGRLTGAGLSAVTTDRPSVDACRPGMATVLPQADRTGVFRTAAHAHTQESVKMT